ncbi:glycosyltransferase family 2 protein [Nocardiopsis sp. NRRL B-16309]|uniref:glycosyltransferase n=1 Tax=Nocardiopsis sp. NRRL B-16309 TaxID=1519494 RepID=UPI0006B06338|nr:glycosyltransferase family 2 protein [Nocardiopsis sp. NRRL B-16309]KOX24155.1 glycosyl transferase family 2 [Nocardiopsis sp. NRRL B-16309]
MITNALRQALRTRGDEPAVLCRAGLPNRTLDALDRLRLRAHDRLVDLDTHPVGEPLTVPGVRGEGTSGSVALCVVLAATYTDLRRAVTVMTGFPAAAHILVAVTDAPEHSRPPIPAAPGLGEWRGLQEQSTRRLGKHGWICEFFFPAGTPVAPVVAGVFEGTGGRRPVPAPRPLAALYGPEAATWRAGDPGALWAPAAGPAPRLKAVPAVDLVLRTDDGSALPDWDDPEIAVADRRASGADVWEADTVRSDEEASAPALRISESDPVLAVPPIDERTVNPVGFRSRVTGPVAELTAVDGRTVVADGGKVVAEVAPDGTVTDVALERMRHLRGVRVRWEGHGGPVSTVRAVASLAAGGVPLLSGPVPGWAVGLGDTLVDLLSGSEGVELDDPLRREEHSVRLRRAALRTHGQRARWQALAAHMGVPVAPEPRVSVILCTRRPEMVGFALAQIARQRGVRLEVVLTLHGFTADLPEVAAAVREFTGTGLPLIVHEADADQVFGSVLNDAVDRVSGHLVSKWDDDDWYGPDHLADLLLARAYSGADLVGNVQDFVYLEELDLTVRRGKQSEMPIRFVSGGTLMFERGLWEEVGGFRPLPRAIDTQLMTALLHNGGRIHSAHGLGYILRRAGGGHTWNEDLSYFIGKRVDQWSGWRPSEILEGEPVPFGEVDRDAARVGGQA